MSISLEKWFIPALIIVAGILYVTLYSTEKNLDEIIHSLCPEYLHVYAFKEGRAIFTNSDDPKQRWAQGFVINENTGKFVHVAQSREELTSTFGKCRKWTDFDNEDIMVMPSFIDSHIHVMLGGLSLLGAPLRNVRSKEEFMSIVKLYEVEGFGQNEPWITGGEWNDRNWGGHAPDSSWIDHLDKPAFLLRMDGHSALVNKKALELAGITSQSKDPNGGTIVRDHLGEPTGLLKDKAMDLVYKLVPPMNEEKALNAAMEHAIRYGVTSVHHMGALGKIGGTLSELKKFRKSELKQELKYRIYSSLELKEIDSLLEWINKYGTGNEWLKVGLLKEFYDGSLGSKTALQYSESESKLVAGASYYINSSDTGIQVHDDKELLKYLRKAEELKFQVAIHAIGEKAVDKLLDLYETVFNEFPPRDRRWRIEHAQQTRPETRKRISDLGVLVSINPAHLLEDSKYAESYIGKNGCKNLFSFHSILKSLKNRNNLSIGSDWFVASMNPFIAIDAAVNRVSNSHPTGFIPNERISLDEAIQAYTIGSAYSSFSENSTGRIAPNFLADFIVLDRNIFNIDSLDLKNVIVKKTFVHGKQIYDRAANPSVSLEEKEYQDLKLI